jgi:hypothetical protein
MMKDELDWELLYPIGKILFWIMLGTYVGGCIALGILFISWR